MKMFFKKHRGLLIISAILLVVVILFITVSILKQNTKIAEQWTRTFGRQYIAFWGTVNSNFPFSMMEVFLFFLIAFCVITLAWAIAFIRLGKVWPFVNRLLMVVLAIVSTITMYDMSVGMAYHRSALPLQGYRGKVEKEDVYEIAHYYVNEMNACMEEMTLNEEGEIVMPYSEETLIYKLRDEFQRLPDNGYFNKYLPRAKPLASTAIFGAFNIVGIFFGVTGEANYSTYATVGEKPFYIMHELSHAAGVMREDDAQLVALYLGLASEDPLIRYSTYYCTIDSIFKLYYGVFGKDAYNEFYKKISNKVWDNWNYMYRHWHGKAFMADLGDKINDWYLRTFGQNGGSSSYNDDEHKEDEQGNVIYLSKYQSFYFKQYYEDINN